MPDRLSMHTPVLVNTLGHCAGTIVFGILLYFLLLDWRRDPENRSVLPLIAAALALLWNGGSLVGMATTSGAPVSDAIVAASFAVLSLLPAVLLHISLGERQTSLVIGGYVVSGLAVLLHIADLVTDAARLHYAAILIVTIGFGVLTAIALAFELQSERSDGSGRRLAGAMVLFLLAISFVHFRADHAVRGWSGEIALHHAALPLALFVLLQDYRFLLLDAFVRFLVNGLLAAVTVWGGLVLESKLPVRNEFEIGLSFVGFCLLISLFAFMRSAAQRLLTRLVFLRGGADRAVARLGIDSSNTISESDFLSSALRTVAATFSALRSNSPADAPSAVCALRHAIAIVDPQRYGCAPWVQVIAPLHLSRGDLHVFCLGPRSGGRRYLSEDLDLLNRMTRLICEHIERIRSSEMQSLVSQAELRALQAQINPHFFFNALNTLYGTIPRENSTARRLVLNLSDLFRHSFAAGKASIRIEEEIRIVRAYLEIEQLRLGPRLSTIIEIDPAALHVQVPVLSIQPLVENAVKHGVAASSAQGFVRLRIRASVNSVSVEVVNSGMFRDSPPHSAGTGVGLANVQRRLQYCYGPAGELTIASSGGQTSVCFSVPLTQDPVATVQTTA